MSKSVGMLPQLIRRYLARTFGVTVISVISIIVFLQEVLQSSDQYYIFVDTINSISLLGIIGILCGVSVSLLVVCFLCEVITTLIFGRTVGKIIYGITVKEQDGENASPSLSLKRSALVWSVGMGLMLPYLHNIFLIISLIQVSRYGAAWWDQKLSTYEEFSPYRWWQWVLGIMAYIAPLIVLALYMVSRVI